MALPCQASVARTSVFVRFLLRFALSHPKAYSPGQSLTRNGALAGGADMHVAEVAQPHHSPALRAPFIQHQCWTEFLPHGVVAICDRRFPHAALTLPLEPDVPTGLRQWLHQLPDGIEHHLELRVVLLFEFFQLARQVFMRRQNFP